MEKRPNKLTVEEARQRLRDVHLRCTACRIAVLRHLAAQQRPVSHADVSAALDDDGFDNSTIYRSLIEFTEVGMAVRLDPGDHIWRFELQDANDESAGHAHFICIDCGQVSCAPGVTIQVPRRSRLNKSAIGDVTEILLKGRCLTCR